ncbi:MAG: TolC family protein, partial [Muribaculaceae bacterium]|nr:TolC family protein [Muribaculaceae bacterium]
QYSFQEAFKTYDMTRKNLTKADENLRQAQLAFREGVLTTDDVTAAQTAWLQANSEKIDAEIAIRLCEVYLSKVTGAMQYR